MNQNVLTIAASKGALFDETVSMLHDIGIKFSDHLAKSRKLFTWDTSEQIRLLQIRPWDVGVYVEQGAADLGIMGNDVLIEKGESVVKLLDLKFGKCKLVLAGAKPMKADQLGHTMSVATKYPNAAQDYFHKKGLKVHVLKLYGAIELAPLTGLSDLICDLTATGSTLKENHLYIVDTLFESSACLVANPVSLKFHYDKMVSWVEKIKKILK